MWEIFFTFLLFKIKFLSIIETKCTYKSIFEKKY